MIKIKILAILLLITLPTFIFGDTSRDTREALERALKSYDVKAVERILKNTSVDDSFKDWWEYMIYQALEFSPKAVLPLLEFGYKHDFQSSPKLISGSHFLPILKSCDEETALFAIKYYSASITEIRDLSELKSIKLEFLNLLKKDNKLNPKNYIYVVVDKIKDTLKSGNKDELMSLIKKISIIKDEIKIWKQFSPSLDHYSGYCPELITDLALFFYKNEIKLPIYNHRHFSEIIKNCDDEQDASHIIQCYTDDVSNLAYYSSIDIDFLKSISMNLLNQMFENKLNPLTYVTAVIAKIQELTNEKNTEAIQALLEEVIVNDKNKDAWKSKFNIYIYPQEVMALLQVGKRYGIPLISDSWGLKQIITNCDEKTALFAIALHPNYVQEISLSSETLSLLSINMLNILIDNGYILELYVLPNFANGLKIFERMLEKDPSSVLKSSWFGSFFGNILTNGRFDFLEVFSKHGITLETIRNNTTSIETDTLIEMVVQSTREGNHSMFHYILDTLNLHGNSGVLAAVAGLNTTLFQDLLGKGYAADPNPNAEVNIDGLANAAFGGNVDALCYFLEYGTDPNVALEEAAYYLPENIEIIELLIAHGLKISNLHVAEAAKGGSLTLIRYFKEKGYNTKHPAIFVAACGSYKWNRELIDFLLADGANINDPSALVAAAKSNTFEAVQYLVERGANPINLMALNQAVQAYDFELKIAKYLIEKGAKLDLRSIINAGLSGNSNNLRWVLEQSGTTITSELEAALNASSGSIVKYTLEHLLPKDAILIGITNEDYHFTDGIRKVASELMKNDPNIFIVPVVEEIASDDSLMIRFSGFINPGAGDSYPKHLEKFSFKDIDEAKLSNHEKLYQKVISFAKKYDIPYLGICLGNQYLSLDSGGYLQPVKGHGDSITVRFEKGSIPHFMTLLPHERAKALQECLLEDISARKASVAHSFAAVRDSLGRNIKVGAISAVDENVPESIYHGHNQIGVQFHPERAYFQDIEGEPNRQKVLLDSFFGNTLNYQKSRSYALEHGFDYLEVRDSIYEANQKLINHLEACAKNQNYLRKGHFWGNNIGSHKISERNSIKDVSVNILTGLTARDLALARDGNDLILIIKSTGEMLSIESHFAPSGEHRVKSIDFADGSRLMLNNEAIVNNGLSEDMEDQSSFYRNKSSVCPI